MKNFFWSSILLLWSFNFAMSQKTHWIHEPFSRTTFEGKSYVKDSVLFEPNESIWGIINHPTDTIAIIIKNAYQLEEEVTFETKSFRPNDLNWHPLIKKYWKPVLKDKNWKYIELLDQPTVTNAYEGVAFLELFDDILQKKVDLDQPQPLYYKQKNSSAEFKTAWFDLSRGKGNLANLLQQMNYYKGIIATRKTLRSKQILLEQRCTPVGFEQVRSWAAIKDGLTENIEQEDLNLFQAIENIKIKTEIPSTQLTTYQKRQLRALFLLDIASIETSDNNEKDMLLKKRGALVQQLNIYPSLKGLLQEYESMWNTPQKIKKRETNTAKNLIDIKQKFKRYEGKWKAHQEIQLQIDALDEQLLRF